MATAPLIEGGPDVEGPTTTANVRVATATGQLASDQADIERGALEYQSSAGSQPEEEWEPVFDQAAIKDFRRRWGAIQTAFVDNPGGAVRQADELVAAVMTSIAEAFADKRANLEQAWKIADEVSTEDLRVALRRYRSFFDQLLSV
jgi:hypothetical protein